MKSKVLIVSLIVLAIVVPLVFSFFRGSDEVKETPKEEVIEEVKVKDSEAPVITLMRDKLVIEAGTEINYEAQIDYAKDNLEGKLTKQVKWNEIDVEEVGEHKIVYYVEDSAGNRGEATLTVRVEKKSNDSYYAPTQEDDK